MASEAPIHFSARDLAKFGITGDLKGEELASREEAFRRMPLSTKKLLATGEVSVLRAKGGVCRMLQFPEKK